MQNELLKIYFKIGSDDDCASDRGFLDLPYVLRAKIVKNTNNLHF